MKSTPMTLDQIVEETRQLPPDVVAELVDRILLTRHGGTERDAGAAWKTEIGRRLREIEEGKVQGISSKNPWLASARSPVCEVSASS
jgi:hypothetical protein